MSPLFIKPSLFIELRAGVPMPHPGSLVKKYIRAIFDQKDSRVLIMPNNARKAVLEILSHFSPRVYDLLLQYYSLIMDKTDDNKILDAMKNSGVDTLVNYFPDLLQIEVADNLKRALRNAWVHDGRLLYDYGNGNYMLPPIPHNSIKELEEQNLNSFPELNDEQREEIKIALTSGIITGNNPKNSARRFRDCLMINVEQESDIAAYRQFLIELNPKSIDVKFRDRRYDRTVSNAIKRKIPLSSEYVEKLVAHYRQRLLQYYSESIARTESLKAIHMGEYNGLLAALLSGKITANVKRLWRAGPGINCREAEHDLIPILNPNGVKINESFITKLGLLRFPLDPLGVKGDIINCTCSVTYKIGNI